MSYMIWLLPLPSVAIFLPVYTYILQTKGSKLLGSAQSLSRVPLFATPWTAALQASLSIIKSRSLLELMSIKSVMPFNHLILYCPLLLLPSIFSSIRVFSNEPELHSKWPKCWSFSFSISPSNEYSGLISFRIDWFNLLAVQETLKSLIQHHYSKVSILWDRQKIIIKIGKLQGILESDKGFSGLPWWFSGEETACNAGEIRDAGLIPGLGRSPGEENGNPLQHSCLKISMDRGDWQATVHGVANSWTQLNNYTL